METSIIEMDMPTYSLILIIQQISTYVRRRIVLTTFLYVLLSTSATKDRYLQEAGREVVALSCLCAVTKHRDTARYVGG